MDVAGARDALQQPFELFLAVLSAKSLRQIIAPNHLSKSLRQITSLYVRSIVIWTVRLCATTYVTQYVNASNHSMRLQSTCRRTVILIYNSKFIIEI